MKNKIKTILLNYGKKHHWFMDLLRFIRTKIIIFRNRKFNKIEVDPKLIVFESFMGRKYVDSPRAIYEYMLSDKYFKDYKFVWFFKNPEKYMFLEKNNNTTVSTYGSTDYYKYYASAGYWITNSRISYLLKKKKNQCYIQCWHGTPLKRLGFDIEVKGGNAMNNLKDIRDKYEKDAKNYDYMVSPSSFVTEKYKSAFNLNKCNSNVKIIEKGRNDFLSTYSKKDIDKIKRDLNIPKNKKVILYAPTWRDNQHASGVGYTYKTEVDFDYLKSQLSKDYILLFRAHYFVASSFNFDKYKGFIYNVSDYNDINDLYIISDLLITDYSSVFFDYSILKRPIIFYMYDLEDYKHNLRDFYIDLKDLPGPIVENEKDLIKSIKDTKNFLYDNKYKKFNERFTYLEDGRASERVVNDIFIKGSNYEQEK